MPVVVSPFVHVCDIRRALLIPICVSAALALPGRILFPIKRRRRKHGTGHWHCPPVLTIGLVQILLSGL